MFLHTTWFPLGAPVHACTIMMQMLFPAYTDRTMDEIEDEANDFVDDTSIKVTTTDCVNMFDFMCQYTASQDIQREVSKLFGRYWEIKAPKCIIFWTDQLLEHFIDLVETQTHFASVIRVFLERLLPRHIVQCIMQLAFPKNETIQICKRFVEEYTCDQPWRTDNGMFDFFQICEQEDVDRVLETLSSWKLLNT